MPHRRPVVSSPVETLQPLTELGVLGEARRPEPDVVAGAGSCGVLAADGGCRGDPAWDVLVGVGSGEDGDDGCVAACGPCWGQGVWPSAMTMMAAGCGRAVAAMLRIPRVPSKRLRDKCSCPL